MNMKGKAAVAAAAVAFVGAAASAQQTSGPIASYWVSAATSSGFGAGMMGGGAGGGRRPGFGAMMGMMMGRGMNPNATARTLTLQLGSTERPTGAPHAEHLIPPGLGMGPSLPLVTPAPERVSEAPSSEPETSEPMQRPRGRMLIYWGCGEHAGPGQPIVFDFSKIGPNMPLPSMSGAVQVRPEHPPSQGTSTTYGHWPNQQDSRAVPNTGSLVGAHTVRGDYSPEIRFNLQPGQDFMPPLQLNEAGALPSGAKRLAWMPLAQATGYHITLFGSNGRGMGGGGDVIFWSSSRVQPGLMGAGLMDYLPPGEVRRLVAQGAVLPPDTRECVVPAEVARTAGGMVMMIAYGEEANFSYPPRPARGPWRLQWTAKVRFKSTTNLILGMRGMGAESDDEGQSEDRGQQQQPQQRRRPSIFGLPFPH